MTTLRYKLLADVPPPAYQTAGASGIDLCATCDVDFIPGQTVVIRTGLAVELPPGTEGQIRPRSSMSVRGLLCHLGTIDADYRGELAVVLTNLTPRSMVVSSGDRIAQLVIAPVERVELVRVEQLSETARGKRGFGHTGKR